MHGRVMHEREHAVHRRLAAVAPRRPATARGCRRVGRGWRPEREELVHNHNLWDVRQEVEAREEAPELFPRR
eukprot:CAMPEP_0170146318 /NCGR_PEP_ID=MMETSP0033_2-20121228/29557_1 /TAXON_ID=195969 /ORGANISM="Dolichomastix tenuilepis, Strain CCMP3274" /LENGTH=71 /DNA_ID=CAMNT_0010383029 /DNA_START=133 /DNA_END=348 /DNA_ORIENTATION=-